MIKIAASYLKHIFLFAFLFFVFRQAAFSQYTPQLDSTFGQGTFNNVIFDIALLPNNKIVAVGQFTHHKSTQLNCIARLHGDGTLDRSFNAGGSGANELIRLLEVHPDGKMMIGGDFTTYNDVARQRLARLNADGSLDTTFNPTIQISHVYAIGSQSDGKIIIGGRALVNNTSRSFFRLHADGSFDDSFNPPLDPKLISTLAVQKDDRIIVGGTLIRRLDANGSLDSTFNTGVSMLESNFDGYARGLIIRPDGKIVVFGEFFKYNGMNANQFIRLNNDGTHDSTFSSQLPNINFLRFRCALQKDNKLLFAGAGYLQRMNSDGSIDSSFKKVSGTRNGNFSGSFNSILVQPDQKIVLAGDFANYNSSMCNSIVRLNPEGLVERTFNPANGCGFISNLKIQNDGKIINLGGGEYGIGRLNANGTTDTTFKPGTGFQSRGNVLILDMQLQEDQKIMVCGNFETYNNVPANNIARINPDGSLDHTFTSAMIFDRINNSPNNVNAIAVQPDGKYIIVGAFKKYGGQTANRIARLHQDGTFDNTFQTGSGASSTITQVVLQADGKIIISGYFSSFNGVVSGRITRLNADGSVDTDFISGTGLSVYPEVIKLQPDGKILIGGRFKTYNGVKRICILRLNQNGTLDTSFESDLAFYTHPNEIPTEGNIVRTLTIQSDGKIIIGGKILTEVSGLNKVFRLNVDGTVDKSFEPIGFDEYYANISVCAIQSEDKLILGGIQRYNNMAYNSIMQFRIAPTNYNTIRGTIYTDQNQDCKHQYTEKSIPDIVVKALPGPYYGGTDQQGNYSIKVDTGKITYTLTQEFNSPNSRYLLKKCAPYHIVSLTGSDKDSASFDFADEVKNCTFLSLDVQHSQLLRCFKGSSYVSYCNYSNTTAKNVQIQVIYPELMTPISSVPMWTSKVGSVLTYDIDSLASGTCRTITIIDSVHCSSENTLGLTQCIEARITPLNTCTSPNLNWDQSSMEVRGRCENEKTNFSIRNKGLGSMEDSLAYRIYSNDTLIHISNYKLAASDSLSVSVVSKGQTIRLEADQHGLHPGNSRPRAVIEHCGISVTGYTPSGLVNTAPLDDQDDEVAHTCATIVGSYDPNDKQASPVGTGMHKQIAPGEEIEYTIRFQNTGTAPAFTVRVVDTLDTGLDATSFMKGSSSHPYTLKITGKGQAVLTFLFNNINLPDSTQDKAGSNGLVSFKIRIPANSPISTVIRNKAYIYFDYNDPILTNETMHTVGITEVKDLSKGNLVLSIRNTYRPIPVVIYPNPSAGTFSIQIPAHEDHMEFRVFSLMGALQKSVPLTNSYVQEITLQDLTQGIYLYEIWQKGERRASGKLCLWK